MLFTKDGSLNHFPMKPDVGCQSLNESGLFTGRLVGNFHAI